VQLSADRRRVSSGSPFEQPFGYCRAVRAGNTITVAGTAPIWPDGHVDPDPAVQAARCLAIIVAALVELGAGTEQVVRTRLYITDAGDSEAVGRAHGRVFGAARPASTMVVVAGLLDPRWKVEIEADAVVD
jgi:enamine deaminase RidA (YjgF/YER057c/UK114 family)